MSKIRVIAILEYPINNSAYRTEGATEIPDDITCMQIDEKLFVKGELSLGDIEDMGNTAQVAFFVVED